MGGVSGVSGGLELFDDMLELVDDVLGVELLWRFFV